MQGDNLFKLFGATSLASSPSMYMLLAALFMIPTVWLPDLKTLSFLGAAGVTATCTVSAAVSRAYIWHGMAWHGAAPCTVGRPKGHHMQASDGAGHCLHQPAEGAGGGTAHRMMTPFMIHARGTRAVPPPVLVPAALCASTLANARGPWPAPCRWRTRC